jgi:hypothetical protein
MRKLATVRRIDDVRPIPGADAIDGVPRWTFLLTFTIFYCIYI